MNGLGINLPDSMLDDEACPDCEPFELCDECREAIKDKYADKRIQDAKERRV